VTAIFSINTLSFSVAYLLLKKYFVLLSILKTVVLHVGI